MTRTLLKTGFDPENETVYLYDLKRRREVKFPVRVVEEYGTILYPGEYLAVLGWAILVMTKEGHQSMFLIESKHLEAGLVFPQETVEKGMVWPVEYPSQVGECEEDPITGDCYVHGSAGCS